MRMYKYIHIQWGDGHTPANRHYRVQRHTRGAYLDAKLQIIYTCTHVGGASQVCGVQINTILQNPSVFLLRVRSCWSSI